MGIGESTRVTNVPTILRNKWIKGLEAKAKELTKEDGGIITKGRVPLPNQMIFGKSSKGWGVIFNPKIYVADFGNFKQGF